MNSFPLGTKLYIPSIMRYVIVEDPGASDGEKHLDIWVGGQGHSKSESAQAVVSGGAWSSVAAKARTVGDREAVAGCAGDRGRSSEGLQAASVGEPCAVIADLGEQACRSSRPDRGRWSRWRGQVAVGRLRWRPH